MRKYSVLSTNLAVLAVAVALGSTSTLAAPAKSFNAKATSLADAARLGEQIFASDTFGGKRTFNGQPATCASCHSNNGKSEGKLPNGAAIPSLVGAAAGFPKFNARTNEIVTLEGQVTRCVKGALQGTPPAADSAEMANLITYLTSLSKGAVMGHQF
jgi:thiosulfate dehydrogenase